MKKHALLFLLAVTLTLGLFSSGHEAQAASPAPGLSSAAGLCPPCEAACLRKCLDAFNEDLARAQDLCLNCTFSVLGVCIVKTAQPNCIKGIHENAQTVYDACEKACKPKPKPKPIPNPNPRP